MLTVPIVYRANGIAKINTSSSANHLNQFVFGRPLTGYSQLKQISASELLRVPHSLQGTKAITLKYLDRLINQFLYQNFEMRSLRQFQRDFERSKFGQLLSHL